MLWPVSRLERGERTFKGKKIKKPEHRREIEQSETPKRSFFDIFLCLCSETVVISSENRGALRAPSFISTLATQAPSPHPTHLSVSYDADVS